ncbi:MAG: TonB-dependent receptor, partial [Tannerella sp.]|nr:TonB-dependent receptor [Tannerella sp.]
MCLLIACFAFALPGFAQQRTVGGKIVDENGQPVPGATILVQGTTNQGTVTDANGKFSLSVPANAILSVSYVGYLTQQVKTANRRILSITLKPDVTQLQDVVVVGYGTQKKATLTGAIVSIKDKDITVTKNENVLNSLSGKLPGVRIVQNSSQPGAFNTDIDIRGMGTPLFVVDGVPRDQAYFSRLDANEIQSVSVLKDASAAIYGLRAANGVILVTTKEGQSGKLSIQYSANYAWQQFLYVPKTVNSQDFMNLKNESWWQDFNNNYLVRRPAYYTADQIASAKTYDWMDALFRNTTPEYNHNLSIDGGSDKVKYYFNLSYMNQDGAYQSGSLNYNRWNFLSNVDAQITKRLKAKINVSGYMDRTNQPNTTIWSVYKAAWITRPNIPIYANDNPLYPTVDVTYSPDHENYLVETNSDYVGYNNTTERQFNGSASLTYDIPGIEGLSAKGMYSYAYYNSDLDAYKSTFELYQYDPTTKIYSGTQYNSPSTITRTNSYNYQTLMDLSLNYAHKFGPHNVSGMLLYEESYNNWDGYSAYRELMLKSQYLFAGQAQNQQATEGGVGDQAYRSYVGKFNYDYAGKYLAEFSFREDGSSRFAPGHRWGFFPAVSVGWRLSEESFLKDNISFLTNLKLRASYGILGDDGSAGTYPANVIGYQFASNDADSNNDYGWIYGSSLVAGMTPTAIPNPNLTWYKSKTLNLGVDVDLWDGKLSGTFEYFQRRRTGLLATSLNSIPGTVGASLPQENLEGDENFGYEIQLGTRGKAGNVSYNISGQLSATKVKWLDKEEEPANNSYDYWRNRLQDRYENIWWGKTKIGQFQNYQQIYTHNTLTGESTLPGDYYYEDWNGDGVINDQDNHPIATMNLPVF